ncbi:hypothetical protein R3X25_15130 [Lutibacter sp. TH_r2]|uniref:hypothetical protein n=1 Tax=Lutibacter sp. TH_r2 TaxID=3082083 RepID=UPI002954738D|nr:hypothetical protein [Lutibacter sp. TH_r2]MDV7188614.1 hypothetical protein [Lutibacter sp. TH_r2]
MKKIISIILIFQSLYCFSQDKYDYSVKRKIDSLIKIESGFYNDRKYDESILICQRLIDLGFDESVYKGYKKILLSKYLKYFPNKDLNTLNEAIEDAKAFIDFLKNSVNYKNDYASIVEAYGLLFQLKYELAEIHNNNEIYEEALLILDEAEKMENYISKEQISRINFDKAKTSMKIYELSNDNSKLLTGFNNCKKAYDYYTTLTIDQIMYFNSKELLASYHIGLSSIENFDYHKKSAEEIILDLDKTYKDSYYHHRIKDIDSLKLKTNELIKQK